MTCRPLRRLLPPAVVLAVLAAGLPAAPPALAAKRRPDAERLATLLKSAQHDKRKFLALIAAEKVRLRARQLCFVSAQDRVACLDLEEFVTSEFGNVADENFMRMALNDMTAVMGEVPGADTLAACGGAGLSLTHLLPTDTGPAEPGPPAGAGGTPNLGSIGPPAKGGGSAGRGAPSLWEPSGALKDTILGRCRAAQMSAIEGRLGEVSPRNEGWDRAVSSATSAMDAAVAACRESTTGPVSNPGAGGGGADAAPTPAPATPSAPDGTPDGTAGAGSPQPPAPTPADDGKGTAKMSAPDAVMWALNESLGAASVLVSAASNPGAAVVGAIGVVAGAGQLSGDAETAEFAGHVGTVSQLAGFAFDAVEAVETGAAAAGAEAVLPVAGAFFAGYGATRLVNEATDGAVDRAAVDVAGAVSDAIFNLSNFGSISGPKGSRSRPSDDSGRSRCQKARDAWKRFKEYCSQPGNDWHTYDCMIFVARMNGCADPGVVNPAPGEDFTCTARCGGSPVATYSGDARAKGIAIGSGTFTGFSSGGASCEERRQAVCEQTEKLRNMLSTPSSEGRRITCAERASSQAQLQAELKLYARKKICERANDPDFCSTPVPGGPAGSRPSPGPLPTKLGTPVPGKPADGLPAPAPAPGKGGPPTLPAPKK